MHTGKAWRHFVNHGQCRGACAKHLPKTRRWRRKLSRVEVNRRACSQSAVTVATALWAVSNIQNSPFALTAHRAVATVGGGFCSASWCLVLLKHLVESSHNVRVKGVTPFGVCGAIAPMFVHPKPWRGIFPDHRFETVPAGLRHLLMIHLRLGLKFLVQDHAPTAI